MQFAYEALRSDGSTVTACLEAGGRAEAADTLRQQGLSVLRLEERAAEPETERSWSSGLHRSKITARDLILLTRQMKMLLEAGTPLVPALAAAEEQTTKPAMRALLARLRVRVEEGDSLAAALEQETGSFDPVFRTMIGAGEATASLPQVFGRLCGLAQQQLQIRKMIIGAMIYPVVLTMLMTGVVSVLLLFVVPRFRSLFATLRSPLPASTKVMFEASQWAKHGWPYVLVGLVAAVAALVVCYRLPATRRWLDEVIVRVPLVGRLVGRLVFARVVRVWAAMLRCHIPLLEAIRQSRAAITNTAFLRLLTQVEESVSSGGRMGQAIAGARLADPVIVSAIRTGEENGRLAEAVDFVSTWLDEDNTTVVQHVTRLVEPILLAVMGVVVGTVAMSLFVPLFDLATAA